MLAYVFCGLLLSILGQCTSSYQPIPSGWIKPFRQLATWHQAVDRCFKQGAVLASPLDEELFNEMLSIVKQNKKQDLLNLWDLNSSTPSSSTSFFIGVHSLFNPERFVSLEGVPLDDMVIASSWSDVTGSQADQCMSMDPQGLHVVPCANRLPFMCYKKRSEDMHLTDCGTEDQEYVLLDSGSCYKVHSVLKNWTDAYAECIDEGGYLAIINDENEERILRQFTFNNSSIQYATLGVRQLEKGGPWIPIHWNNIDKFRADKVNTPDKLDTEHLHVQLLGYNGTWGYNQISAINSYICERDPKNIKFPREGAKLQKI